MFITIADENQTKAISEVITNIVIEARYFIYSYAMHSNELALDEYLQKNYNLGLKPACLYLINNRNNYITSKENEILFLPKIKEDDKLAEIICKGIDKIFGSNILYDAFLVLNGRDE